MNPHNCKNAKIGITGTRMLKLSNRHATLRKVIVITQTIKEKPRESIIKIIHNQEKKPLEIFIKRIQTPKRKQRNAIKKIQDFENRTLCKGIMRIEI